MCAIVFLLSNLAPVGVGACVCHGEEATLSVPQLEVLVLEGAPVDGLAAGAVVVSEVAALRRKSIFIFYLREMELGRGFSPFLRRFFWWPLHFRREK